MAYEATLLVETGHPIPFTCADGTGIAKGAILKMNDPMTAIINSGAGDVIAGIAANEKIADNGATQIAVFREGIFKVYLCGSCTAGDALGIEGTSPNVVVSQSAATSTLSGSRTLGIALEDGTEGHSIKMELKPMLAPFH